MPVFRDIIMKTLFGILQKWEIFLKVLCFLKLSKLKVTFYVIGCSTIVEPKGCGTKLAEKVIEQMISLNEDPKYIEHLKAKLETIKNNKSIPK